MDCRSGAVVSLGYGALDQVRAGAGLAMSDLATAFFEAFSFFNILMIFAGVMLGIIVGAIPGLSAPMAIAIAVPLTFYMDPLTALAFLISVNKGGTFGGAISGILLNTPGSPEAAATTLDGYPLAKKGQPIRALRAALFASNGGDFFSDLVLILVAAPLALFALKLGPVEIGALVVVALAFVSELLAKSPSKGLIAVGFGLLVASVGADPTMAIPRMTFGSIDLQGGVPLMSVGIGILALSEVLVQLERRFRRTRTIEDKPLEFGKSSDDRFTRKDLRRIAPTIGRSAVIGTVVGALPGLGTTLAAFLGYSAARRSSKTPESFGKGNIEGVAGAEAANSAVVGANLIPLLALGIPGNIAAALLVGAFIIHGIVPGPWLFEEQPVLIYGLFISMVFATCMNLIVGNLFLRYFAMVLRIPAYITFPSIVFLCVVGSYINEQSLFAVGITLVFGIVGYLMRQFGIPVVPFIIGLILGPMLEHSLSQTYVLTDASLAGLLDYPVALALYLLALIIILRPLVMRRRPSGGGEDNGEIV
ncbi:tripartite tricarboxylate transporter permease [Ruegeria sp. 2012CJ41-6]|uniref:Tripartite tricarboxylate transporter permease n=1 Tax=Ruegeria spongiae TaxID=2942209 RepID=A0ABT0Q6V1_9RHOB|nr:tripartite tricarboxylate transporter permease [Ruegeria spongiae]MCL6285601.1 tripartite tricarboxylate transporter permease [Ruegeria spongiae]